LEDVLPTSQWFHVGGQWFHVGGSSAFGKQPHSSERKKHCFSFKKTTNVQSKRDSHVVYQCNVSPLLKGLLPISPARTLSLFKTEFFK
jgi:hypothetical protein